LLASHVCGKKVVIRITNQNPINKDAISNKQVSKDEVRPYIIPREHVLGLDNTSSLVNNQ
jgi:hypothetical protein